MRPSPSAVHLLLESQSGLQGFMFNLVRAVLLRAWGPTPSPLPFPSPPTTPAGDWVGVVLNRIERTISFSKKGCACACACACD